MKKLCVWAVAALLMAACTPKAEKATDSGLLQSKFQTEVDGKKTDLFTLRNKNNMEVCITNFGGRIVSVMVPDKDGVHTIQYEYAAGWCAVQYVNDGRIIC
jgi:aldose 1-epimerase